MTTTVTLEIPEAQVVAWVRRLSPSGRHAVLRELILGFDEWEAFVSQGEQRIRALAAERGADWDHMDESARERWVDDLLHQSGP